MNCNDEIFTKAFEITLIEHGFSYQYNNADNTYAIIPTNEPDQITKVQLIGSEPNIHRIHGNKNNTDIKETGYFLFEFLIEGKEPDFYIFAFNNRYDNRVEFVIIPYNELKYRLTLRKCITRNYKKTELKFWLLSDDLLFESNFGAEGEFWFVDGRMAKDTVWDYTPYLNRWDGLLIQH